MTATTDTEGPDPMLAAPMLAALALARRGLGSVWPNPAVGCLLTVDDLPVDGRPR